MHNIAIRMKRVFCVTDQPWIDGIFALSLVYYSHTAVAAAAAATDADADVFSSLCVFFC